MADFITLVQTVWAIEFAVSETVDLSFGQLVIFSTILGIGVNFARGLIRG